jgi:hypothetical protein
MNIAFPPGMVDLGPENQPHQARSTDIDCSGEA